MSYSIIRNIVSCVVYSLVLCAVLSCVKEGSEVADSLHEEVPVIMPTGSENYLNLTSDYIFDESRVLTFELNLPEQSLAFLDADPAAEAYVEGALTFEGETISPVGIRYKGSIGGFVGCVSGSDWTNPSGYKTCTKLSMKVKINWDSADTKFYGLKKLQFHSQNLDPSLMHERLGYWLYRQMGVAAPRSVHARLIINGQLSGLYALTEQIDGRFTRYHFDHGDGNLYKEVWPLRSDGMPQSGVAFLNALRTNEEDIPNFDIIKSFGEDIYKATETDLQSIVSKWMSVEKIINHMVVDRTIRNDDGPLHWYCGGNQCANHNYYWYEDPSDSLLYLIPWDLDNAFENIISDQNPVTPIADAWGETRNNCHPFSYGPFGFMQRSAACDKVIKAWSLFEEEYIHASQEFKKGPFSESSVESRLTEWGDQIRPYVIEASETHGDAVSPGEWEAALDHLRIQLAHARSN